VPAHRADRPRDALRYLLLLRERVIRRLGHRPSQVRRDAAKGQEYYGKPRERQIAGRLREKPAISSGHAA
jgi:hypothetical protein